MVIHLTSISDNAAAELWQSLKHQRADHGPLARFLRWAMPRDPEALYVPPFLAHAAAKRNGSIWRFLPLVVMLFAATVALVYLFLQVPYMNYSVVSLLTKFFGLFLPPGLAAGAAWGLGIYAVLKLGSFVKHTDLQQALDNEPASKNGFYNFWLKLALWEEMIFRAGCEKWTWAERIRASFIFGTVHIINIWYSFAAGIALSLTGFAFLLVYLWDYRRTKSQVSATAISGTVHAMYNTFVMVVLIALLVVWPLAGLVIGWLV